MNKKIASLFITGIMSTALLAGCAPQSSAPSLAVSSGGKEGLTPITFVRSQDPTIESNVFSKMKDATYEDNLWTDLIAERLGYDVKYLWISPAGDPYTQKFNASISTGEIPDILSANKIELKRMVEADLLLDIKPYFDQYASDFVKELVASAGDAATKACTYDGVQYGIPYLDCDLETAQMLWLRQDWLDELKLTAPKTLDELTAVLKAFKEHAGAGGVGLALSQDLYGNQFDIKGLSNAYGAYPNYWVEDKSGKLVYGNTTPQMKEALGGIAKLYEEGLIDPEFFVYDGQKANEALVNGKCGAMYGFHASPLDFLQSVVNADEKADWIPYMIPMKTADETITPGVHMCTSQWWVVSKECKSPQALIEMLNLYCEKVLDPELNEYEIYSSPGNGIEGVWKLSPVNTTSPNKNQVTAKAIEKPLETGEPGDLVGEQLSMFEFSYAGQNGDKTMWGWNKVFGKNGGQQLLLSYQNSDNVKLVYDKFLGVPGEIMTTKKTTLDDMLQQTFIKIISGQEKLDAFDTVVAEWSKAGGQDMTDEVNQWYSANK